VDITKKDIARVFGRGHLIEKRGRGEHPLKNPNYNLYLKFCPG